MYSQREQDNTDSRGKQPLYLLTPRHYINGGNMFNIYKKNFLSLAVNCIWLSAVNALSLMDTFHANMSA